jgi:hypothetical protein
MNPSIYLVSDYMIAYGESEMTSEKADGLSTLDCGGGDDKNDGKP